MKVLFVNPSRAGQGNIPINVPLLISVLKNHGHEVSLFDFSDYKEFDDKSYEKTFFKEAVFDEERIVQDRLLFYGDAYGSIVEGCGLKKSDYCHDFEHHIHTFQPEIVAVSCLSTDYSFIEEFLLPFKIEYDLPVVFGGIHAILQPNEVINSPVCDYVCIGEGERCLVDLLDVLSEKEPPISVRGLWYKQDDKIRRNPPTPLTDLSSLPVPDFDCFDPIHFYRPFDGRRFKMLNYELSRGCPFNCTYCVNGVLKEIYKDLGRYHRTKSVSQGIYELKGLIDNYSIDFIRFWDEDFTAISASYLEEYAEAYTAEIKLPFLIYARVESVTDEKVKLLKQMGCRTFALGIESGNEFIRRNVMNRKMSNEMIIEKFGLVKSHGIRVSAYNMIGLPYETRSTVFETIELNRIVNPDAFSLTILEPYKGTPIRKMCEAQGLDPNHQTTFDGTVQFVPPQMTKDELEGLYRTFPLYVRLPKERYHQIHDAEHDIDTFQRLLAEIAV